MSMLHLTSIVTASAPEITEKNKFLLPKLVLYYIIMSNACYALYQTEIMFKQAKGTSFFFKW